jgi:undecaprenyl phosphate-alpha-L-ara4FN deformylase
MLSLLRPNRLNVLTIHAEAEGGCYAATFSEFLDKALDMGITIIPLGKIIEHFPPNKCSRIIKRPFPGRRGWLSIQKDG